MCSDPIILMCSNDGGIVIGIDGGAGHPYKHFSAEQRGYFLRLGMTHNVSAVTGALMMIKRECYVEVGGLDESIAGALRGNFTGPGHNHGDTDAAFELGGLASAERGVAGG